MTIKPPLAVGAEGGDGPLDPGRVAYADRAHLDPERRRGDLDDAELGGAGRHRGIPEHRDAGHGRRDLFQQLQPFRGDAVLAGDEPGGVAAGSRQAVDETGGNRIADNREYDRDGAGRLQQRTHGRGAMRQDDVGRERGQLRRVPANFAGIAGGPARLDADVAANVPAQQRQPLQKRADADLKLRIVRGSRQQHADAPHPLDLLGARR
jgi:hypothetical protein